MSGPMPPKPLDLGFERLVVVGTGSIGVMHLPFWLNWLRLAHPGIQTRAVVTRSATRFVTRQALTSVTGHPVREDVWPEEPEPVGLHVELAEWAEAIAVYPATLHFVGRFALGLADTPTLLAAQCATVPVGIAPALPPGGAQSAAYMTHLKALEGRRNVVVAPPERGPSTGTGRNDGWVAADLPALLGLIEERRLQLADTGGQLP
ncbi:flavoprotein [Streptomyces sp. BP-8]|uniref:Flavoprotein n=1 Tax=Streptomyces sirii TaxID=3127701 RepID=A0ABZ2QQN4_9ACTN